jgi:hypothetical protein
MAFLFEITESVDAFFGGLETALLLYGAKIFLKVQDEFHHVM